MNSMVEVLAAHAMAQPGTLFVADDSGTEYTYADAWTQVRKTAWKLANEYGVSFGDNVMVECNQDAEYLITLFACQLIGAVIIPIEGNASYDRKQTIQEETESKLWIYRVAELDFVKGLKVEELFADSTELLEKELPKAEDTAEILYTTGTTGKSKGIVVSNRANVALAENIKYGVNMKPGNVELIPLPISHSHGIRCCYANLLNGGTIVLIDGLMRIKNVFALMDKYHVTALDISPSAATLLIKLSKGSFWAYGRKLDYIQIGTAALPEGVKNQLLEELPGVHLFNFYGSTESGRSCVLDFSVDRGKMNCIGKATKNAEIVFTDDDRKVIQATAENPGLLASRGSMNMDRYWKNQELTDEIMRDNFIFTNDLGYIDAEGYIYVLGRRDDVINYNGIKISPDEIEEVAVKYEGVTDAACIPIADATAGQVPKLYISVSDAENFNMKEYSSYLTSHLDGNKIPKRIEIIDVIPRTFNGKLQRKVLIALNK